MKLRLEKGAIKFRLTTSEIELLMKERSYKESFILGNENKFIYKVVIDQGIEDSIALFTPHTLELKVPAHKVERWTNTNQIGIKETIITDNDERIVLTLEEDLPPRKFKKS